MYQSVFKDIWGSDLIFAGPHKSFTNVNKTSNINHVIFVIHSVNSEPKSEDEPWTDEREYAIITDSNLGLTVNPFLLNPDNLLDVGGKLFQTLRSLWIYIIMSWRSVEQTFLNICVAYYYRSQQSRRLSSPV